MMMQMARIPNTQKVASLEAQATNSTTFESFTYFQEWMKSTDYSRFVIGHCLFSLVVIWGMHEYKNT